MVTLKLNSFAAFLGNVSSDNRSRIIFALLNINSIRNKFELLKDQIKDNIDIPMISEKKNNNDVTFPHNQLFIEGFSTPYRLDRDSNVGGILLYVRKDIPSNLIAIENKPIESFFVELKLHNDKWLINSSHNPHKSLIGNHFDALSKYLDSYSSKHGKVLILGDFNADIQEKRMKCFCDNYNLKSLIKQPTCYKNPDNPTCIDLLLTNAPSNFQSICCLETCCQISI